MLKDFKNIIEGLGLSEEKYSNYTVMATCFNKYDEKKKKTDEQGKVGRSPG